MQDNRNNRAHERNACFIRGEIILNTHQRLACEVTDISEKGARVVTPHVGSLPEIFSLEVPRRHILSRVRVMRRGRDDLGIRFLD